MPWCFRLNEKHLQILVSLLGLKHLIWMPLSVNRTGHVQIDTSGREIVAIRAIGSVSGMEQGWKEGHKHGVIAAQFLDGWPKDEQKALAALPVKQLQAASAAMSRDVPCIPGYVTIGQERDIVVNYIREQQKKNPFITIAKTYHVVWLAFQEAFLCPAQATKPPDAVK